MKIRILACLCALLLGVSGALAEETAAPSVTPAPTTTVVPATTTATQTVRVLLSRLGVTDRADLTLDGSYSVELNGQSLVFERGSQIAVLLRAGRLIVGYEGLNVDAGTELSLVRHPVSGGSNGLRFANNTSIYEGDLRVSAVDGKLRMILTIDVEDYLNGVVPYEMSDSFPIEALKAQAVAARTYAITKALANAADAYDVVDTTNDQVYRGRKSENTQAAKAIAETRGVCGFYKGELAMCYYSASNGGQTELLGNAWETDADGGYLDMRDDPYDLENPQSKVQSVTIPKKTAKVEEAPYVLRKLLSDQLADTLKASGYDASPESLRVDTVTAVSVDTPKFGAPSRLYTTLHITFTYSARTRTDAASAASTPEAAAEEEVSLYTATPSPVPTPSAPAAETATATPMPTATPAPSYGSFVQAEKPVTLDIAIFPDAEQALSLGINYNDNELITVVEKNDSFVIESRRFGHGLGMSQRGAEWMAMVYGKTYQEILAFYYPGMTLMQYAEQPATLSTVAPALLATAGPAPTATPRPTLMPVSGALAEGQWIALVTEIDDDSSLNLRAAPDGSAEILRKLYKYQRLLVLEVCPQEGWLHVKTDAVEGYVMEKFLTKEE